MKIAVRIVALLSCCAAVPLARLAISAAAAKGGHAHAVLYRCPMHPAVVQGLQGQCPVCGMKLVPIQGGPGRGGRSGGIAVSPAQQEILGVSVERVERRESRRALRLAGRVVPDDALLHRITSGLEGSVRDLSVATAGSRVRKGEVLGSYYAPSAYPVLQLYLLNTAGRDRAALKQAEGSLDGQNLDLLRNNLQQRRMQLENLGVSAEQREEIARTRRMPDTIRIVSPIDGFVLARNLAPGVRFDRGMELYRIADLRRVWVLADVFAQDAPLIRIGMAAQVLVPGQPIALPGTVAQVLARADPVSRALRVRVEADNPGFVLRPEMFAEVRLEAALPPALAVPAEAVVDTGLSRIVFVEIAEGVFEPRPVETGWRSDGRVEIVAGLGEGQRIAVSGAFFLDSESRMRTPPSGARRLDPEEGERGVP